MAGTGLMEFAQRFESLQTHRHTAEQLIKDLMDYVQRLLNENQRLLAELECRQLDLADAKNSRRVLQQQLRDYEDSQREVLRQNNMLKNRNPYVVILIDGDGLIFKDSFLRMGIEGGKKAANVLREAVAARCRALNDDVEIICKVCANLSGLAKAMIRDGTLNSESDLKDFTLGFTQAKASFDFVDVGYGKERVDSKIQESTRFHLRNFNCKQILLGVSHDAGYAPFLDEICRDDYSMRLITILEGTPTQREIASIGIHTLNFTDRIFRAGKLVDRRSSFHPASPVELILMSVPPKAHSSQVALPAVPQALSGMASPTVQVASPALTSIPSMTSTPDVMPAQRPVTPPPSVSLPIKIKPLNSRKKIVPAHKVAGPPQKTWNPGKRGLDPPLQVNQSVLEQVKRRRDSDKLCNNHYLRGSCSKGDDCCFQHYYEPSKDEVVAIAYLARLNPCTNGQECDVTDCIYGHHCPSTQNGVCRHPHCKFREDEHPPGSKHAGKPKKQPH